MHVHHRVWGILLVLVVGLLAFRFRPDSPWVEVLATLFGVGAALALDEFALWLHLEDVYWSEEGRKSVDAVMIAAVFGLVLLAGTSPIGIETSDTSAGVWTLTVAVLVHVLITVICLLKGKIVLGLVGLPARFFSYLGAFRLAKPESFWATRFYRREKTIARAARRHATYQRRRLALRDRLFGG